MIFVGLALSQPVAQEPSPDRPAGHATNQFRTALITAIQPDWRIAHDQLRAEMNSRPEIAGVLAFGGARRLPRNDPRRWPAITQINAITAAVFPRIDQSPVPVLLPFDTAGFMSDRMSGSSGLVASHYQSGFRTGMFDAGPAGYDAVFSIGPADDTGAPQRTFAKPVDVHITGSTLIYNITDPFAGRGETVKALSTQYPDLRRVIREGYVRYAFSRFGVPYVVSIQCLDSAPRRNRLACREASLVAERFLLALRVTGGKPHRLPRGEIAAVAVERPLDTSPDFTFKPVGAIISNSGTHGQDGHADATVYAQIRFPLKDAPAYANSQSFLNWGNCDFTGRTATPRIKGGSYRCKRNNKPLVLDESAAENYSYPWQDNFCESRSFEVGQCASGFGHQGQDIRPSLCPLRNDGADRCEANHFATVAVRDGVIVRSRGQQAALLLINTAHDHARFRYMHMNPAHMDDDGVLNGRSVAEGETIGLVSNFQDYPGGTTTHLHFDLQVFTRDGWLWVNPYVTLVAAYERLLGARGTELSVDSVAAVPAMVHPVSDEKPEPASSSEGEGQ